MAVKEKKKGSQKKETGASGKKLRIKLVRSLVGRPRKQREVVRGLGLRRINSEVMRRDCPEVRGMVDKVSHLVNVEELDKK
ncbi:MAG TPA: 50S ribosomal protein L30 [Candidatus Aminicenantes bacterium]|nr:50S ribosomal protein L30 [Candidatus Aminicenantes bacterium]